MNVSSKIIFTIEEGTIKLACELIDYGVDAIIQKPFTEEDIIRKLKKLDCLKGITSHKNSCSYWIEDGIKRAEKYLLSNIDKKIRQKDILEIAAMSRTTFYRKFKEHFGITYSTYLRNLQLEQAKSMLSRPGKSIKEVSDYLCFEDANYFSSWFKKYTGLRPLEFKRIYFIKNKPIKLGLLVPLSGLYSYLAQDIISGMKFALAEAGGGINTKIKYDIIDTATDPNIACNNLNREVQTGDISYFVGCVRSAVFQQVARIISKRKALLLTSCGLDLGINTSLNNVFRWGLPTYEVINNTIPPLVSLTSQNQRWVTITTDSVFGHALLKDSKSVFNENKKLFHIKNYFVPLGCFNFKDVITKALSFNPDIIALLTFGPDTLNILRQAARIGVKTIPKFVAVWSNGFADLRMLGNECPHQLFLGSQYYQDINLDINKYFINQWRESYGISPSTYAVNYYMCLKILLMSFKITHSFCIKENIEAIKCLNWEGLTVNQEFIQASNNKTYKNYFLLEKRHNYLHESSTSPILDLFHSRFPI